jgi:hypothetical protein
MNYVVLYKNQQIVFYHAGYDVIQKKCFSNEKPNIIMRDIISFSVDVVDDDLYMFGNSKSNAVSVALIKNKAMYVKQIFDIDYVVNIKIQILSDGEKISLIHVCEYKKNIFITRNNFLYNEWSDRITIDQIDNLIDVQKINNNSAVFFYKKKHNINNQNELLIGYRNFTSSGQGRFHTITSNHSHNVIASDIIDTSFLVVDSLIHTLYLINNIFTKQVIYFRKNQTKCSPYMIAFDYFDIIDCIIMMIKGDLYVSCRTKSSVYIRISNNNGISFTENILYEHCITDKITKVKLLTDFQLTSDVFVCNEVYISNNTLEIKILSDIFPNYFGI